MRIYRRNEFMELPAGTVYCSGKEWYFGDLAIKGETLPHDELAIDWWCTTFAWVDGNDSGECTDRLEGMLKRGESWPVQNSECRDGSFDPDAIFLVYEAADLRVIRGYLDAAIDRLEQKEKTK